MKMLAVSECDTRPRNQKFHPIEHPANAIPITGLFDRVNMDLMFCLPPSYGKTGIALMVDSLSKTIRLAAIPNISAETTAECIWQWIRIYGPV